MLPYNITNAAQKACKIKTNNRTSEKETLVAYTSYDRLVRAKPLRESKLRKIVSMHRVVI